MKNICLLHWIVMLLAISSCNRTTTSTDAEQPASTATGVTPTTNEEVQGISEVITRFVRAYASKDNEKANQLVHPDLGVYIIYRPGVADNFTKIDSFDFQSPLPEWYAYPDLQHDFALTFEKLPVYNCDDFTWDKQGFVCDTTMRPMQLVQILHTANEFYDGDHSPSEIKALEEKANNSFRVVVTADDPLIFHVQHYEGKWYVTVLDRAYTNCDA